MSEARPRKVLFITADQMRADCLYGPAGAAVPTPNLDRLAARGVSFRNHYTQCAPCGPARASLLTGLYAMNHRSVRNGTPLDARHGNLALEMRRAGYEPMLFGYTDTTPDPRGRPAEDPALRSYEGVLPGMSVGCLMTLERNLAWRADLKAKGYEVPEAPLAVYAPIDGGAGFAGSGAHAPRPRYRAEDSDTAYLTDRVLEHLAVVRGEPWFLHVCYLRPHPPIVAPEPYASLVDPAAVELPRRAESLAAEAAQHPLLAYLLEEQKTSDAFTNHDVDMAALDEAELRQVRAGYYGLVAEVDHHLGRILDHLEQTGEDAETLVVFTSDHGEMLGDHWLWGKESYFDGAFHVPLVIRDPRPRAEGARGGQVDAFTEAVDLMPTMLDWVGLPVPVACDGASLLPFLAGERPTGWRRAAHWELDFRDVAEGRAERALGLAGDQCALNVLRDERFKYVHFTAMPPLLFDLRADPHELRDVAADPDYRDVALEYAQGLLSRRMLHAERRLANTVITPAGPVERRGPRT